jgi:hypothetical protein
MRFVRTLPLVALLGLPAAGLAQAQSPWPSQPQQQTAPWPSQPQQQTAPWPSQQAPQASGFSPAQQASPWNAQPQAPPCMADFGPLRDEAAKRAQAVRTASEHHATPQEACQLIGKFSEAETKMVKYAETNATTCGIPAQALKDMRTNHERTAQLHKNVCMAAANPRPTGPSLSDALDTSRIPTAESVKKGNGTFDTLTGNAILR